MTILWILPLRKGSNEVRTIHLRNRWLVFVAVSHYLANTFLLLEKWLKAGTFIIAESINYVKSPIDSSARMDWCIIIAE